MISEDFRKIRMHSIRMRTAAAVVAARCQYLVVYLLGDLPTSGCVCLLGRCLPTRGVCAYWRWGCTYFLGGWLPTSWCAYFLAFGGLPYTSLPRMDHGKDHTSRMYHTPSGMDHTCTSTLPGTDERHTPGETMGQTNTCENITFACGWLHPVSIPCL